MWLDHVGSIDHVCTICVGTRLLVHDIFRGVELLYEIFFFLNGDRSSSGNLQGVCFRANTVGKPLSTDSSSASDSTIFPMRSNTLNCQWF